MMLFWLLPVFLIFTEKIKIYFEEEPFHTYKVVVFPALYYAPGFLKISKIQTASTGFLFCNLLQFFLILILDQYCWILILI